MPILCLLLPIAAEEAAPGSEGLTIMINQGCNACHSSDGSKIVGPSYLNLFGEKQIVIRDGKEVTVTVDEEYIKKAIIRSKCRNRKRISEGFNAEL